MFISLRSQRKKTEILPWVDRGIYKWVKLEEKALNEMSKDILTNNYHLTSGDDMIDITEAIKNIYIKYLEK